MTNLLATSKPSVPRPELRRESYLAHGLEAGWFLTERGGRTLHDVVGHRDLTVLTATAIWSPSIKGSALLWPDGSGVGDRAEYADNVIAQVDNWSLVAQFRPDKITQNRQLVFGVGTSAGNGFYIASSGDTAGRIGGLFGGVAWLTAAESYVLGQWYTVAMIRTSGTTRFVVNGVQLSYSSGAAPGAPGNLTLIGADANNTHIGPVAWALAYSRPITLHEARELHLDPYQLIRPRSILSGRSSVAVTTTIQLDWTDNSEHEDGFSIERKTDAGAFGEIDTVAAGVETYANVDVPVGHTYTYRVKATSLDLGDSEYSNEAEEIV